MVGCASLDRSGDDLLGLSVRLIPGFVLYLFIENSSVAAGFLLNLLQNYLSRFVHCVTGDLLQFLQLFLQDFVLLCESVFNFSFFVCDAFFFFLYVFQFAVDGVFLLVQSPLGL